MPIPLEFTPEGTSAITLRQWSPAFWAPGTLQWKTVFPWGGGRWFRMIQAHSFHGALSFCSCYVGSTSRHQALGRRSWGRLPYRQGRTGSAQQREAAHQEARPGLRCLSGQARSPPPAGGGGGGGSPTVIHSAQV